MHSVTQVQILKKCFKICKVYLDKNKTNVVFSVFIWNIYLTNDIDQGIHKINMKSTPNEKQNKKTTWGVFLSKYSKIWSISLEFKFESNFIYFRHLYHIFLLKLEQCAPVGIVHISAKPQSKPRLKAHSSLSIDTYTKKFKFKNVIELVNKQLPEGIV